MWFVWSRTSYSGDKWLKVGRRRRCHHGDNRTESENRACQLIDTGLLTFSIRKEARKYKLLCRFYNTLFSGSGSRLWQLLLNCMVSQVRTTEYNTKHNNTKGSCQKKNVFFLGYLSQMWMGGVSDSQTRSKPLKTPPNFPENRLFRPKFHLSFSQIHCSQVGPHFFSKSPFSPF